MSYFNRTVRNPYLSITDNSLTRFDSTTGLLVQGSPAYVDDTGNLTISGIHSILAVGSANAPALTLGNDPDTGLYASAADEISFATNGVQRFKITNTSMAMPVTSAVFNGDGSSAAVNVQVTANTSVGTGSIGANGFGGSAGSLDITGFSANAAGTAYGLSLANNARLRAGSTSSRLIIETNAAMPILFGKQGTTEWMRISSTGLVGIGTQNPVEILSIQGNVTASGYYEVLEQTTPSTPSSGLGRIYAKSDSKLYFLSDTGTEYDLTASGAGAGITGTGTDNQITVWSSSTSQDGSSSLTWDGTTFAADGAAVFNDSAADRDFRIESQADANLFFTDASALTGNIGAVGVGTAAPQTRFEVVAPNTNNANFARITSRHQNANSYSSLCLMNDQNNQSRSLELGYTGTTYAGFGVNWPNAATGEFGYAALASNYNMVFGQNNIERFAINTTSFVANDAAQDYDFRIEGQTKTNLFFLDASANRIGINRTAGNVGATVDIDNTVTAEAIFMARDNGTAVLTLSDGGALTHEGGAVFNEAGAAVDFRIESDTNSTMFHLDGTNNSIGFGTSPISSTQFYFGCIGSIAAKHGVKIVESPVDQTSFALYVDVTPTATAGVQPRYASYFTIGGSATTSGGQMAITANAQSTGTGTALNLNTALNAYNSMPGGNHGLLSLSQGTTTGLNTGSWSAAANGGINIAAGGKATIAKNSATNIGAAYFALNTGTSPIHVAGYFGLQDATPTFASAALMADNGTTTSSIFVARDGGTAKLTVLDGGLIIQEGGANFNDTGADVDFRIEGDTQSGLFFVDASTDRIGINNVAPAAKLDITGGTLADQIPGLALSGTLADASGSQILAGFTATSSASATATAMIGLSSTLSAGYVGIKENVAIKATNSVVGTGNDFSQQQYTVGISSTASAASTFGLGLVGRATGAGTNSIGTAGYAGNASSTKSIGAYGHALVTPTHSAGGYFTIGSSAAPETTFSGQASLIIDNLNSAEDIFYARNNGSNVFEINNGGLIQAKGVALLTGSSTALLYSSTSPAQITGNQDNYNPGTGIYFRLSSDASRNITGFVPGADADGRVIILCNVGSQDIVLKHQDAASTAANRFLLQNATDITLSTNHSITLIYDLTTTRWRVISQGK